MVAHLLLTPLRVMQALLSIQGLVIGCKMQGGEDGPGILSAGNGAALREPPYFATSHYTGQFSDQSSMYGTLRAKLRMLNIAYSHYLQTYD